MEELNLTLGNKTLLQKEKWPEFDASMIVDKEVEVVVQVNGKVKGKIKVAAGERGRASKVFRFTA